MIPDSQGEISESCDIDPESSFSKIDIWKINTQYKIKYSTRASRKLYKHTLSHHKSLFSLLNNGTEKQKRPLKPHHLLILKSVPSKINPDCCRKTHIPSLLVNLAIRSDDNKRVCEISAIRKSQILMNKKLIYLSIFNFAVFLFLGFASADVHPSTEKNPVKQPDLPLILFYISNVCINHT